MHHTGAVTLLLLFVLVQVATAAVPAAVEVPAATEEALATEAPTASVVPAACTELPETGPCRAFIIRYFFDLSSQVRPHTRLRRGDRTAC